MKMKKFLGIAILSLWLVACSKPLPEDKLDYVGHWISADSRVQLNITANGRIEYSNNQLSKKTAVSAPIKQFSDTGFETGLGPINTKFIVTRQPYKDAQGNWYMIVDGHTLAKLQNP
ncbi:hypothetical protein [Acinetobacter sp. Ver3]|uniref:hypothetical protein n=1 Tax=Acinetobacter sp. Ver3 TaxID=466088 RepID=UPI000A56B03D|nr:hypothetical protein [Acinetobacter sp. Ver3]